MDPPTFSYGVPIQLRRPDPRSGSHKIRTTNALPRRRSQNDRSGWTTDRRPATAAGADRSGRMRSVTAQGFGGRAHGDRDAVRRRAERGRGGVRRPDAPPRRARLGRLRRLRHHRRGLHADRRGAPARHRAGGPGAPPRQHHRRRDRFQQHPARGAPDRAGDRARRRCGAERHPVLQPPQPSRHPGALRRGLPSHRQADRALQRPVPGGHRPAQRPARRAGPARPRRVHQAGEQREPGPRRRPRSVRGQRRRVPRTPSSSADAAASWSPATSWASRCAGWSTSPSTGPRSTPRCATCTRRWGSPPTPSR